MPSVSLADAIAAPYADPSLRTSPIYSHVVELNGSRNDVAAFICSSPYAVAALVKEQAELHGVTTETARAALFPRGYSLAAGADPTTDFKVQNIGQSTLISIVPDGKGVTLAAGGGPQLPIEEWRGLIAHTAHTMPMLAAALDISMHVEFSKSDVILAVKAGVVPDSSTATLRWVDPTKGPVKQAFGIHGGAGHAQTPLYMRGGVGGGHRGTFVRITIGNAVWGVYTSPDGEESWCFLNFLDLEYAALSSLTPQTDAIDAASSGGGSGGGGGVMTVVNTSGGVDFTHELVPMQSGQLGGLAMHKMYGAPDAPLMRSIDGTSMIPYGGAGGSQSEKGS